MTETFDKWFASLRELEQEKILKHIEDYYLKNKTISHKTTGKHLPNYCPRCKKNYYKNH